MTTRVLVPAAVGAPAAPRGRLSWSFTPRTLRLLCLGVPLFALVWLDRRALAVVALWDLVVFAAWAIDLRRLPAPDAVTVTRTWHATATLGAPQRVTLGIANASTVALHLQAIDFVSPTLRAAPAEVTVHVPARASGAAEYDVLPVERGDARLDAVALRYRSPLGLAERWARASLPQIVRVYPDIADAQRQALSLIRARHSVIEKRRAVAHGLGRDFDGLRDFQPGDELRDVCWTATARRGKLVTRTYRPERSQAVWLVVDAGRLMRARDGRHSSLDRAVNAAFALAQVASAAGDRVGLLAYGRRTQQRVPPGRGAAHLRTLLDALALVSAETAEANHVRAAATLMSAQKRRALVVWLTDVAEAAAVPEVIDSAARLVPRHVLLFAVTRPAELSALAALVPDTDRDLYRVMAAQEMVERRAVLLGQLRQRGAMAIEVGSAELTGTVVNRYLGVRARNLL